MKEQVSAWRHGVQLSHPTLPCFQSPRERSPTTCIPNIEQPLEIDKFLELITAGLKTHGNRLLETTFGDQRCKDLTEKLQDRLEQCETSGPSILHSMELPSLSVLTELTVLESLRCRSQEINRCILSFFLIDLQFIDHLNILNQFLFCNDVMFNERLSNALFGSNDEPAQERLPVGVSARLIRRGTWPPGGFDLSFALRTVVLDSVAIDQRPASYRHSDAWDELEDRLSFAIRPGTEREGTEPAYEANSIDGFEFLMIDFKPPKALKSVLGPELLESYQIINTYLMKLLRLQSIMKSNWRMIRLWRPYERAHSNPSRNSQERYTDSIDLLAMNSQRLLDGLISYTWEIAIGNNWSSFVKKVEDVKEFIRLNETWMSDGVNGEGSWDENRLGIESSATRNLDHHRGRRINSIEELTKLHRATLNEILNCLFLRKKQEVYSKLLSSSIFQTIIDFSLHLDQYRGRLGSGDRARGKDGGDQEDGKVDGWIEVIEGIQSRQTHGIQRLIKSLDRLHRRSVDHHHRFSTEFDRTGFLKEFLIRLDFNSYYFEDH